MFVIPVQFPLLLVNAEDELLYSNLPMMFFNYTVMK